ncbi:hypothetical protein R3W88_011093 [Solanum pinnatisectum]|uniref:Uncharacterized protein n=1 Tax=Solanum pinnatisectum TaxID=50273 RepID=A0AAV9L8V4_9SOLN|nr:hypothetical protein R3W88_011093 [Solanum pinnatisectum]
MIKLRKWHRRSFGWMFIATKCRICRPLDIVYCAFLVLGVFDIFVDLTLHVNCQLYFLEKLYRLLNFVFFALCLFEPRNERRHINEKRKWLG